MNSSRFVGVLSGFAGITDISEIASKFTVLMVVGVGMVGAATSLFSRSSEAAAGFGQSLDSRCFVDKQFKKSVVVTDAEVRLGVPITASPVYLPQQDLVVVVSEDGKVRFYSRELELVDEVDLKTTIKNTPSLITRSKKFYNMLVLARNGESDQDPAKLVILDPSAPKGKKWVQESKLSLPESDASVTEIGEGFVVSSCKRKVMKNYRESTEGATEVTADCFLHIRDLETLEETRKEIPGKEEPGPRKPIMLPGFDILSSPTADEVGNIYLPVIQRGAGSVTSVLYQFNPKTKVFSASSSQLPFEIEGVPILIPRDKEGILSTLVGGFSRESSKDLSVAKLHLFDLSSPSVATNSLIEVPLAESITDSFIASANVIEANDHSKSLKILLGSLKGILYSIDASSKKITKNDLEVPISSAIIESDDRSQYLVGHRDGSLTFLNAEFKVVTRSRAPAPPVAELGRVYGFPAALPGRRYLVAFAKGNVKVLHTTEEEGDKVKVEAPCKTVKSETAAPSSVKSKTHKKASSK